MKKTSVRSDDTKETDRFLSGSTSSSSYIEQNSNITCQLHHNAKANIYCDTCNSFACNSCLENIHKQHRLRELKPLAQVNKDIMLVQLLDKKIQIQQQRVVADDVVNFIKEYRETLEKQIGKEMKKACDTFVQKVKESFQKRNEEVLQDIRRQSDFEENRIIYELHPSYEEIVKKLSDFSNAMELASIGDILSPESELRQSFQALIAERTPQLNHNFTSQLFIPTEINSLEDIERFGFLSSNSDSPKSPEQV